MSSRIPTPLCVLAAAILLGTAGCGSDGATLDLPPDTPVILVIIDTLRADHLSCYGYELPTSPVIDSLARESLLFERNTTQCNATFPSMTSIMTGLFVKTHRNYLAVPIDGMVEESQGAACLAERFDAKGYHTIAAISHPTWAGEDDAVIMRGWDRVTKIDPELPFDQRSRLAHVEHTHERLFPLLDEYEREHSDDPLFMWVHYFDPHTDLPNVYDAPEPYRNLWLAHHMDALGVGEFTDGLTPIAPEHRQAWIDANVPAEKRRTVFLANGRALYDGEITSCDAGLGRLFDRLRAMGLWDEALVVVMADHGENMESEVAGHGTIMFSHKRLYEGVVHTPFMIRLPGGGDGLRLDSLVQNVDLAPTLVDLLALPAEPACEGESLLPILTGITDEVHSEVFVESSDHIERAVKSKQLKYIDQGEFDDPLVYAWRRDPDESTDIREHLAPAKVESLSRALDDFRPIDVLHLMLTGGDAAREVSIDLELPLSVIDRLEGAPQGCLSEEGRRFRWQGTVGPQGLVIDLFPRRRNTDMIWRLRENDQRYPPERVWLGRACLPETTAIPVWEGSSSPAPQAPILKVSQAPDERLLQVEIVADSPAAIEVEVRYPRPTYEKNIEVLESIGFGALTEGRARVFELAAEGTEASAQMRTAAAEARLHVLARLDGRWPDLDRVSFDGAAIRDDELAFVFPFPLDGRVTTDLMSSPRGSLPANSIVIWLESSTGGALYDEARLDPDLAESLRQMGYLDGD